MEGSTCWTWSRQCSGWLGKRIEEMEKGSTGKGGEKAVEPKTPTNPQITVGKDARADCAVRSGKAGSISCAVDYVPLSRSNRYDPTRHQSCSPPLRLCTAGLACLARQLAGISACRDHNLLFQPFNPILSSSPPSPPITSPTLSRKLQKAFVKMKSVMQSCMNNNHIR